MVEFDSVLSILPGVVIPVQKNVDLADVGVAGHIHLSPLPWLGGRGELLGSGSSFLLLGLLGGDLLGRLDCDLVFLLPPVLSLAKRFFGLRSPGFRPAKPPLVLGKLGMAKLPFLQRKLGTRNLFSFVHTCRVNLQGVVEMVEAPLLVLHRLVNVVAVSHVAEFRLRWRWPHPAAPECVPALLHLPVKRLPGGCL